MILKTTIVGIVLAVVAASALEADPATAPLTTQPTLGAAPAVAVLDYESAVPGNAELGKQLADVLSVRLSLEDAFTVVERAKLNEILNEHKLTLAGVVDSDKAAQVGKLLGAKLLIMGKVFPLDKKLMLVTKVVGVETGQLKGTLREVDMAKPLGEAIALLAEDVSGVINKDAARLLPKDAALADPMAGLRQALAARKDKPSRIAVVIPEEHRTRVVIDPAVETEIKKTLIGCGFTVVDTGQNDLADWAKKMLKNAPEKPAWPAALNQADYVIVGEAFSEFAARSGELVSCAARAEINVIDRKTGTVVLADRATGRAVDLAEALAGKTALQKAGHELALAVLEHFVKKP